MKLIDYLLIIHFVFVISTFIYSINQLNKQKS